MRTKKRIQGSQILCEYKSSNIKAAVYEIEKKQLDVTFNTNQTYRYFDVDHDLFTEFDKADSQGKTFNKKIKSHKFEKLEKKS